MDDNETSRYQAVTVHDKASENSIYEFTDPIRMPVISHLSIDQKDPSQGPNRHNHQVASQDLNSYFLMYFIVRISELCKCKIAHDCDNPCILENFPQKSLEFLDVNQSSQRLVRYFNQGFRELFPSQFSDYLGVWRNNSCELLDSL